MNINPLPFSKSFWGRPSSPYKAGLLTKALYLPLQYISLEPIFRCLSIYDIIHGGIQVHAFLSHCLLFWSTHAYFPYKPIAVLTVAVGAIELTSISEDPSFRPTSPLLYKGGGECYTNLSNIAPPSPSQPIDTPYYTPPPPSLPPSQ